MRIRRSVTRFFSIAVLPAMAFATVSYFGYYAIWGERGMLALTDVQDRLGVQREQLAQIQSDRQRLEHRIQLIRPGNVDNDLVEELARGNLMEGVTWQLALRPA